MVIFPRHIWYETDLEKSNVCSHVLKQQICLALYNTWMMFALRRLQNSFLDWHIFDIPRGACTYARNLAKVHANLRSVVVWIHTYAACVCKKNTSGRENAGGVFCGYGVLWRISVRRLTHVRLCVWCSILCASSCVVFMHSLTYRARVILCEHSNKTWLGYVQKSYKNLGLL